MRMKKFEEVESELILGLGNTRSRAFSQLNSRRKVGSEVFQLSYFSVVSVCCWHERDFIQWNSLYGYKLYKLYKTSKSLFRTVWNSEVLANQSLSYFNIDTTVHKCCSSCSVGTCLELLNTRWPMIITLKIGLWPQECTTSHSNANIPSVTLLPPVFLNIMRTSHRGLRLMLIVLLINL